MLTIKFSFQKEQNWNFDQYILQWIFYNAVWRNSVYHWFTPSLFTFSNIYPFKPKNNYLPNQQYYINFKTLLKSIEFKVYNYFLENRKLPFWSNNFINIHEVKIVKSKPTFIGKKITGITPIVISIDKELAEKYNIPYNRNWKPLYWKKEFWFDIFVKQLHKNLLRKYILILKYLLSEKIKKEDLVENLKDLFFSIENWEEKLLSLYNDLQKREDFCKRINFFQWYKFIRGALIPYKGGKIAGSVWDFIVGEDDDIDVVKILKINSLIGFWEKTSIWLGFIN